MHPPATSDLIFSEQANHNFSKTLGELKRSTLSIQNRLRSIEHDADFVQHVRDAYNRPLIANERCGSWYIDPRMKGGGTYFKSTDGHTGVWKFSLRRLNLHLLNIIEGDDGCIIIDSTRRGKRMPDALSKTIPIWCNILNRLIFPNDPQYHELYTPPQVVSKSEHAQIIALLPSFLAALKALNIPAKDLQRRVSKPLRPVWVTPDSNLVPTSTIFEDFHPVICCTVSRRVAGGELSEGGYIQGAGDDTENWAHGLSPPIFWENKQLLLSTTEGELPDLIEMLVRRRAAGGSDGAGGARCVKPTSYLFITPTPEITAKDTGAETCTIVLHPFVNQESEWQTSPTRLDVGVGPHKVGSRNLREVLGFIMDFAERFLYIDTELLPIETDKPNTDTKDTQRPTQGLQTLPQQHTKEIPKDKHIILACHNGQDLSIGVALTLLCLYFDNEGELLDESAKRPKIDKGFIRSRLAWISTSMPDVNPSRATLQSVNSFLMGGDHGFGED